MNILYTLDSGNPGGMEKHVLHLVQGMVNNGHNVYVWCKNGPIFDWYKDVGAKVTPKDFKVKFGVDIDPFYIFDLIKFIKEQKIDIVHSHELRAVGNSLIAGKFVGVPVVSIIHTPFSQWQIPEWKKTLYTFAYSIAVRTLSAKEIAVSETTKKIKMNEGFGIPAHKLEVILNALEIDKFDINDEKKSKYKEEILARHSIKHGKFVFGMVSRVTQEKGHKTLIQGFKNFLELKDVPQNEVFLLVVGGGDLEEEIRQQVKNLKIQDKVIITGRFKEEDKVKYYSAMDAFVFTSYAEGYGIVLVEALASGLPVISSNLPVLQEVAGSSVFSYFETKDPRDLAQKMYNLYSKRDNLNNVKENSVERVRDLYSMDEFVENYNQFYLDLLNE